jgi:hypothetical protein
VEVVRAPRDQLSLPVSAVPLGWFIRFTGASRFSGV